MLLALGHQCFLHLQKKKKNQSFKIQKIMKINYNIVSVVVYKYDKFYYEILCIVIY
jgi:hypothetical protein